MNSEVLVKFKGDTKDLETSTKKVQTDADKMKKNLTRVADGINAAFAVVATSIAAMGAALVGIGKQALTEYSNYEQLVGGVETLFKAGEKDIKNFAKKYGMSIEEASKNTYALEGAIETVMMNARNAYKTAGVSANEYMEGVNSFAASLLQATSGSAVEAADIADMAFQDMADNANKMGTSMSAIQNAYQGFAKQNYTMLDNLKLGYGGTKTEMERLLKDAEKLSGVKYDISNLADVYTAIHVIQEEMGITETTAKEAASTISGSTNMMKAAWKNVLVAIADGNQEIGPAINDFVDTVIIVLQNILPRVKEIMSGLKDAIIHVWEEVIPMIEEEYPEFKPFINAMQWIVDNGKIVVATLIAIKAAMAISNAVSTISKGITAFKKLSDTVKVGKGIMAAFNVVLSMNPIGLIVTAIAALVAGFIYLWNTSDEFREFWINLWEGIKNACGSAIDGISNFINNAKNFISTTLENIKTTINNVVNAVINFFVSIPTKISEIIGKAVQFVNELPRRCGEALGMLLGHIANFFVNLYRWFTEELPLIIDNAIQWFRELPGKIWDALVNAANAIGEWVEDTKNKAIDAGKTFLDNVITFFRELPGKIWDWLTKAIDNVKQWFIDMKDKAIKGAQEFLDNVINGIKELPEKMKKAGSDMINGLWGGITEKWDNLKGKVNDFKNGVIDGFKKTFQIKSPSRVMKQEIGVNLGLGVIEGLDDTRNKLQNEIGLMSNDVMSGLNINPNAINTSISPQLIGNANTHISPQINVVVNNSIEQDPLGQMVNNIKTFSGGAKNDYNYGMGN